MKHNYNQQPETKNKTVIPLGRLTLQIKLPQLGREVGCFFIFSCCEITQQLTARFIYSSGCLPQALGPISLRSPVNSRGTSATAILAPGPALWPQPTFKIKGKTQTGKENKPKIAARAPDPVFPLYKNGGPLHSTIIADTSPAVFISTNFSDQSWDSYLHEIVFLCQSKLIRCIYQPNTLPESKSCADCTYQYRSLL